MDGLFAGLVVRALFGQQLARQHNVLQRGVLREKVEVLEHQTKVETLLAHFTLPLGGGVGSPFTLMTPVSGRSRKFRQRSRVVLPEPDEPMMASASPCSRVSEMSLRTWVSPKFFPMPEASSNAIIEPLP